MASSWIGIGNAGRLANEVRSDIDQLRYSVEKISRLDGIMRAFNSDYTALGAALGLPAADAESLYVYLDNANGVLTGFDVMVLLNKVG